MFVAPRGCGKTMLATLLAATMKEHSPSKVGRVVNCASIKNLNQFINGTIIPYIHNKDCTLLLDEASESSSLPSETQPRKELTFAVCLEAYPRFDQIRASHLISRTDYRHCKSKA